MNDVKLLDEEQKKIVADHLKRLSDDDILERIDQYRNMPTCFMLAMNEASARGLLTI